MTHPLDSARHQVASCRFTCAQCGRPALALELFTLPPKSRDEEFDQNSDGRLVISGFIGLTTCRVESKNLSRMITAIRQEEVGTLRGFDPEYVACFCSGCERHYCIEHWSPLPMGDGGFYDCTYGICPAGHRQKLDD